jgi:hypothetical protein
MTTIKQTQVLYLHPSTKKRILEHLAEIEYVMWQIKLLLEKEGERKRIKRKIQSIKKKLDKTVKNS